jgi:four helix bundle protein
LPKHPQVQVIGKQILKSGTSVGANYREGYRARSPQEFISKLGTCLQELEETTYWIELLEEGRLVPSEELTGIKKEADELTAIFVSSIKTMKSKEQNNS